MAGMNPSQTGEAIPLAAMEDHGEASFGDRYLGFLFFLLFGYATFGKGFAYIGVPPLFISEIALCVGLIFLIASGYWLAVLMTVPALAIILLIGWVVTRTLPFVPVYGFDALRDSVLAVYGLFAFIMAALVLQKPQRLKRIVRNYSRFALFYGFSGAALAYVTTSLSQLLAWPFSGMPVVYVRMGEASVHLCGATVFALLGLRRVPWFWIPAILAGFLMISISRGAMLSFVIPVTVAAVLGGKIHRVLPILGIAGGVFLAVLVMGVEIETEGGRMIGPAQLVDNVESVVGRSDASNLDGTKTWRLRWWKSIQDYTIHGPYFWTGKGFGINLAEADGYVVGTELGGTPVRAPHSAHINMLARAGVPGLILWILVGVSWFAMMLRSMMIARDHGEDHWANLFLWLACYGLSIVVDSSFDVALEGPMIGIWFWCILGLGIGSSMVYRAGLAMTPRSLSASEPFGANR